MRSILGSARLMGPSMVQRRLEKFFFFFFPLCYSLIRMPQPHDIQFQSRKVQGIRVRIPIRQGNRLMLPSDIDCPTGSGPILVFGPCPRISYFPRCFKSLSDRTKSAYTIETKEQARYRSGELEGGGARMHAWALRSAASLGCVASRKRGKLFWFDMSQISLSEELQYP